MNMKWLTLLMMSGVFFLTTQNAYAYLDPGTGSLIFQMLVGAILAVGMVAKLYWQKLKSFFSKTKVEPPAVEVAGLESKPEQ